MTDLFFVFHAVANSAALVAGRFSPLSAVPLVAGVDCDAVQLRETALAR
jgi:hypothetical protein